MSVRRARDAFANAERLDARLSGCPERSHGDGGAAASNGRRCEGDKQGTLRTVCEQERGYQARCLQVGRTLIMVASANGHTATVELLHRMGVPVTVADKVRCWARASCVLGQSAFGRVQDGWTAIMLASRNGHMATMELLHRLGADARAADQACAARWGWRVTEQICDARRAAAGRLDHRDVRLSERACCRCGAAAPDGRRRLRCQEGGALATVHGAPSRPDANSCPGWVDGCYERRSERPHGHGGSAAPTGRRRQGCREGTKPSALVDDDRSHGRARRVGGLPRCSLRRTGIRQQWSCCIGWVQMCTPSRCGARLTVASVRTRARLCAVLRTDGQR
jgi:hypothetical protein